MSTIREWKKKMNGASLRIGRTVWYCFEVLVGTNYKDLETMLYTGGVQPSAVSSSVFDARMQDTPRWHKRTRVIRILKTGKLKQKDMYILIWAWIAGIDFSLEQYEFFSCEQQKQLHDTSRWQDVMKYCGIWLKAPHWRSGITVPAYPLSTAWFSGVFLLSITPIEDPFPESSFTIPVPSML